MKKSMKNCIAMAFVIASLSASANWSVFDNANTFVGSDPYFDNAYSMVGGAPGFTIRLDNDINIGLQSPNFRYPYQISHDVTVDLNGKRIDFNGYAPPQSPTLFEIVANGNVCVTNGYISGDGNLFDVNQGRLKLANIQADMQAGLLLNVQNGGYVEMVDVSELRLHNTSPTIQVQGDCSNGAANTSGNQSVLSIGEGSRVFNHCQQGKAIAGVPGDVMGTKIVIQGGNPLATANADLPAKICSDSGIAIDHPQPGSLWANGDINGATCIAMTQGALFVDHAEANLSCSANVPAGPIVYDGSMPTGDTIVAPLGQGANDPKIRISAGYFHVAAPTANVCLRTVLPQNPPNPGAISNNVAVSGGWFETPVQVAHCARVAQRATMGLAYMYDYAPVQVPGGDPRFGTLQYTVRPVDVWKNTRTGSAYPDFNSAASNAQSGDTIHLMQDASTVPGSPYNLAFGSLTVDLRSHVMHLYGQGIADPFFKIVGTGRVGIVNGRVDGDGMLVEVDRGSAELNDLHVVLQTGRPLTIHDGGSVEVLYGSELSLNNDPITVLIRGNRMDGSSGQGRQSELFVKDGGLVNNGCQQGVAISGVVGDPTGTEISLVGGVNSVPTPVGSPSKVTSTHGFAVYHPQPGRLWANGELAGASCISMLNGELIVNDANALLQCIPQTTSNPNLVFDGSMPTGDTIIAPFGLSSLTPASNPKIEICAGLFSVADPAVNICLRANDFAQNPTVIDNNVAISGGWFETAVLPNHCATANQYCTTQGQVYGCNYQPDHNPSGCPGYPQLQYTVIPTRAPSGYPVDINGTVGFPSLEEAFAVSRNNDTVNVNANVVNMTNTIEVTTRVTLHLHGNRVNANAADFPTGTKCAFLLRQGAHLEIYGIDATGTVRGELISDLPSAIQLNKLSASPGGPVTELMVNDTWIEGKTFGIRGVDLVPAPAVASGNANVSLQTDITLISSHIEATDSLESTGIRHPQFGNMLLDGSTVKGMTGVEFDGGNLNVRNGSHIQGDSSQFTMANGYPLPFPSTSTSYNVAAVGAGILIAPRHPVHVDVYGGSRVEGAAGIYEYDLYAAYHPVFTQFMLDLRDCWIAGNLAASGGKTVYCNHGWDFTRYAVDVGSQAKFKNNDFYAGPLPVGYELQLQTAGVPSGWYMLGPYGPLAANQVMVVYKPMLTPNGGTALYYSQLCTFQNYSPGVSFGLIPPTAPFYPSPTGYSIDGWYTDVNLTQLWDFSADMLMDYPSRTMAHDALTDSRSWGDPDNVKNLYVKLIPSTAVVGPNNPLPWAFASSSAASSAAIGAAANLQVQPPSQVQQSSAISPTAYQSLFTVRTVEVRSPLDPEQVRYVCQVVLRDEVAAQQRANLANAMRRMPVELLSSGPSSIRIATTPGLFYSVISGATLDSMTEGDRILAEGTELELTLPSYPGSGFYRLAESETPE